MLVNSFVSMLYNNMFRSSSPGFSFAKSPRPASSPSAAKRNTIAGKLALAAQSSTINSSTNHTTDSLKSNS